MKDKLESALLDSLISEISKSPKKVNIGFFDEGERHPRSGESAPDIAAINNFGGESLDGFSVIPRRPFFDEAIRKGELEVEDVLSLSVLAFLTGKESLKDSLEDIGNEMFNQLFRTIRAGRFKDNAELTIKLKGRNRPLFETGWLLTQIKIKLGDT